MVLVLADSPWRSGFFIIKRMLTDLGRDTITALALRPAEFVRVAGLYFATFYSMELYSITDEELIRWIIIKKLK